MANEQNKGTQNTSTDSGNESTAFSEFSDKNQDKSTKTGSTETGSSGIGATGSTSPGSTNVSGTGSATPDRPNSSSTSSGSGSFGSSGSTSSTGTTGSTSGASSLGTTGSSSTGSSSTGATSGSSSDSGSGLSVESAKETAKGLYDQAKNTAGQAFGAATKRATEALDEKKVTVASGLTSVADSIKQVGENLNTTDEPNPIAETAAKYTNSIAQQIENLSGYFERKDVRDMVRDVESFARRNPAYFIGGAVALGFLAARFLKSSNPKQSRGGAGRTFDEGYDTGKALTAGETTPGSSQF